MGRRAALAAWLVVWLGLAALSLLPATRAPQAISRMIASMVPGEPAWLAWLDTHGASVLTRHGPAASVLLAAVLAAIALAPLTLARPPCSALSARLARPPRLARAAILLALAVAAALWLAQGLGGIFTGTGTGTDPGTGPLLALLALDYWPAAQPPAIRPGAAVQDRHGPDHGLHARPDALAGARDLVPGLLDRLAQGGIGGQRLAAHPHRARCHVHVDPAHPGQLADLGPNGCGAVLAAHPRHDQRTRFHGRDPIRCTVSAVAVTASPACVTELELVIGGMTCAACAARVQKKLTKLDGVVAAVNLATERARVTAPPGVPVQVLIGAVEAAGYTAELAAPPGTPGAGEAADEAAVRRLRRRLILALVFFVPLTDMSIMLSVFPWSRFPGWQWTLVALAAPVATWAAWPFHAAALRNARHLSSSMDTLVSMGILAACGWSVYAMFVLDRGRPGRTARRARARLRWGHLP